MATYSRSFALPDGSKVSVDVRPSSDGSGIVVSETVVKKDGTKTVNCHATCSGKEYNWTCADGESCDINCVTGQTGCHKT